MTPRAPVAQMGLPELNDAEGGWCGLQVQVILRSSSALTAGATLLAAIPNVTADAPLCLPGNGASRPVGAPLFAAALSLARWHSRHRFCANCGHEVIVRGGWSRRCPDCAAEHYPRVDPVVIMLAEHDGQTCLLGRQPQYPPGRIRRSRDFVEVGETSRPPSRARVQKRPGSRAKDPLRRKSALALSVLADARLPRRSGRGRELPIDTAELEDARWFGREEVAAAWRSDRPPFEAPPQNGDCADLLERWLARLS